MTTRPETLFADPRPKLLDLFCGAGGASRGYHDAGFEVVGVDISPQRNYPYEFHQFDALEVLAWLNGYDNPYLGHQFNPKHYAAIHASPPCQRYSDLAKRNGNADSHPDLIGPVRELLKATGLPYVIENVEGAPLNDPVTLCGTTFGLGVDGYRLRRHRLFESSVDRLVSLGCACRVATKPVIDVSGGGPTHAPRLDGKGGRTYKGTALQARRAMGIDWMTKAELNEAIPPRYTEFIGSQLIQHALVEAVA